MTDELFALLDQETTCQSCGKAVPIRWREIPIQGPNGPLYIGSSACCGSVSLQVEGPRQPRWVYEQLVHLVTGEEVSLDDLNLEKDQNHGKRTAH